MNSFTLIESTLILDKAGRGRKTDLNRRGEWTKPRLSDEVK
jgi:hypothetical protein